MVSVSDSVPIYGYSESRSWTRFRGFLLPRIEPDLQKLVSSVSAVCTYEKDDTLHAAS